MTPLNHRTHQALLDLASLRLPVDKSFSDFRALPRGDEIQKDKQLLVEAGILNHLGMELGTLRDVFTFTELGKKLYLLLRD